MKKVFVLGSINYDLVIRSPYMPKNGETLTGSGFMTNSGGKGANQAVACSKLGAKAYMMGAAGEDGFGKECLQSMQKYGVDISFVQTAEGSTGVAVIVIADGDNRIILDPGANNKIDMEKTLSHIEQNVSAGDIFISQLEIPLICVAKGFEAAKRRGAITILNPAPAKRIGEDILKNTDILIPNESEAEILSGIPTNSDEGIERAVKYFNSLGIKNVIITLGKRGCTYNGQIYPAYKVENVVDTTAAGDTFLGTLASCLSSGKGIAESIPLCQKACAIKITRKGAQMGIPTLDEVLNTEI